MSPLGLAATHMLDAAGSRVLMLPNNRIKLMGAAYGPTVLGMTPFSMLQQSMLQRLQYEDLVNLGRLLLSLVSQSFDCLQSRQSVATALQEAGATLSQDAVSLMTLLLSTPQGVLTTQHVRLLMRSYMTYSP